MLEIYRCARQDDVDGGVEPITDMDELYEIYDGVEGQDVVVARTPDNMIVGVASFDARRTVPFFEGVSVDPDYRGNGIAAALVSLVLARASDSGITELHARSQPSSLEANRRMLLGTGVDFNIIEDGEKYPLIVISL